MLTITAVQGQKRPPPNSTPCCSTDEGRPSHSSIVTSAKVTSSRCQLQPVFTSVPAAIRPLGIRALPPALAAFAASTCALVVSFTRNNSACTRKVTTAETGEGVEAPPSDPLAHAENIVTA